ncbi:hypothetical protein [Streptomyces sp. NPDC059575]|uniref:hypothetical protein n=1 Tax=Streptomyces sp. NPDC059575 TaxID=3346872 RepID=UPI00369677BA
MADENMRSAMRQLEDIGPRGAGSAGLEDACDDFQDKWGHGIKLIAAATGGGVAEKGFQKLMPHLIEKTPLRRIPALADSVLHKEAVRISNEDVQYGSEKIHEKSDQAREKAGQTLGRVAGANPFG